MKLSRAFISAFVCVLAFGLSVVDVQAQEKNYMKAKQKLAENPNDVRSIAVMRNAKNPDAIASLRNAFRQAKNKEAKKAASASLLALGGEDAEAKRYLFESASKALDRNIPFPYEIQPSTGQSKKVFASKFITWVESNGMDLAVAADMAVNSDPKDVLYVGLSKSTDGIPILLRALNAVNSVTAIYAVQGLARMRYEPGVPRIIAACAARPPELAAQMAQYLILFESPEAQDAMARFISDEKIVTYLRNIPPEQRRRLLLGE